MSGALCGSCPRQTIRHWWRSLRWLTIVTIVFFGACTLALAVRSPLGHDESVYALRGRDILQHGWSTTSGAYWRDYRAPGLPIVIAGTGRVVGVHVTTSRMVVVVFGAVTIAATWYIVTIVAGRVAGDVAAALLAVSAGFVYSASTLLADVPGAAFALLAVAVFAHDVRQGRLKWSLLLVPLLCLAAATSRFGAPFLYAAGLSTVAFVAAPRIGRERNWALAGQSLILALSVMFVTALVLFTDLVSLDGDSPAHANSALVEDNDLTVSNGLTGLWQVITPSSDGLVDLWSPAVGLLFLGGVLLACARAVSGERRVEVVALLLAAGTSAGALVVAIGQIVANYLVLTLPFWAALASLGWEWPITAVGRRLTTAVQRQTLLFFAVVALGALTLHAGIQVRSTHQSYVTTFGPIRAASIDAGSAWAPQCGLVTGYGPQVGYYSECEVVPFVAIPELRAPVEFNDLDRLLQRRVDALRSDADEALRVGVFLVETGKRQPMSEQIDGSNLILPERQFEYGADGERRRHAWVQELNGCLLGAEC